MNGAGAAGRSVEYMTLRCGGSLIYMLICCFPPASARALRLFSHQFTRVVTGEPVTLRRLSIRRENLSIRPTLADKDVRCIQGGGPLQHRRWTPTAQLLAPPPSASRVVPPGEDVARTGQ